jgi:hypothetical protein
MRSADKSSFHRREWHLPHDEVMGQMDHSTGFLCRSGYQTARPMLRRLGSAAQLHSLQYIIQFPY